MRVLIYHDRTGLVKTAFRELGHKAYSCDTEPCDVDKHHIIDSIFSVIRRSHWDLLIAFPSCTYLCVTGNKWMKPEYRNRFPKRPRQREIAIKFFLRLSKARIEKICIENPVGIMSTVWRKPDQYVHPYYFGRPYIKKTGLWLKNLPKLTPTQMVEPLSREMGIPWYMEHMKLSREERNKARAKNAIKGMHLAMAEQWGELN